MKLSVKELQLEFYCEEVQFDFSATESLLYVRVHRGYVTFSHCFHQLYKHYSTLYEHCSSRLWSLLHLLISSPSC